MSQRESKGKTLLPIEANLFAILAGLRASGSPEVEVDGQVRLFDRDLPEVLQQQMDWAGCQPIAMH